MQISNTIKKIQYGGWTFKGDNTTLTMLDMKAQINASLRDIGNVFNVSHETVNLRFNDVRENHPDLWQDAETKRQFYANFIELWESNTEPSEICKKLFISMGQYRKLENNLIPLKRRKFRTSIPKRKNNLAHSLFGYQFNAGDEFDKFVIRLFKKKLSEPEFESLFDYYFNGADVEQKSRFARNKTLQKVKIEFDHADLLERNILCRNLRT